MSEIDSTVIPGPKPAPVVGNIPDVDPNEPNWGPARRILMPVFGPASRSFKCWRRSGRGNIRFRRRRSGAADHCTLTIAVVDAPALSGQGRYRGAASTYLANARPGTKVAVTTRPSNRMGAAGGRQRPARLFGAAAGGGDLRGRIASGAIGPTRWRWSNRERSFLSAEMDAIWPPPSMRSASGSIGKRPGVRRPKPNSGWPRWN